MSPQYILCSTCGQLVDATVPKSLCAFCSPPGASSRRWVTPVAGATLGLFAAAHVARPEWGHDKGKLTPTDLPYEQKHIEQVSSTSTTALPGGDHLATIQVGTSTATPVVPDDEDGWWATQGMHMGRARR
jgi:hypothetical protein